MARTISSTTLDQPLSYFKTNIAKIHICSQLPTTFAQVATYTLGNKSGAFTVSNPTDMTNGRKISVSATTGGTVTATGTATHVVVVSGTEILGWVAITSQAVTEGNTFNTSAFDFEMTSV